MFQLERIVQLTIIPS